MASTPEPVHAQRRPYHVSSPSQWTEAAAAEQRGKSRTPFKSLRPARAPQAYGWQRPVKLGNKNFSCSRMAKTTEDWSLRASAMPMLAGMFKASRAMLLPTRGTIISVMDSPQLEIFQNLCEFSFNFGLSGISTPPYQT